MISLYAIKKGKNKIDAVEFIIYLLYFVLRPVRDFLISASKGLQNVELWSALTTFEQKGLLLFDTYFLSLYVLSRRTALLGRLLRQARNTEDLHGVQVEGNVKTQLALNKTYLGYYYLLRLRAFVGFFLNIWRFDFYTIFQ